MFISSEALLILIISFCSCSFVNAAPSNASSSDTEPVTEEKIIPILSQGPTPVSTYDVIFAWKKLDFDFPSDEVRQAKIQSKEFIPENNTLTGIKVHDNRIFLTVPRWKKGVPATLAYINSNLRPTTVSNSDETERSPKLKPFPSWEFQEIGNCSVFQYVQSMEIDQYGRMWVVDVGRADTHSLRAAENPEEPKCSPKLVLINLSSNTVEFSYEFPEDVVDRKTSFLNDIVVGCKSETECMAYITDAWDSRLVVFSLKEKTSWSVTHSSMEADPDAYNITISGKVYPSLVNIDGIALSTIDTQFNTLFYCPLSSYDLYSIETSILLNYKPSSNDIKSPIQLKDEDVKLLGRKSSQSDGLAMAAPNYLYYGQLQNSSISFLNLSVPFADNIKTIPETLLVQNEIDLQWPDTFAFDNAGFMYSVTNKLQKFFRAGYDFQDENIRIVRTWLGLKSYMFPAKDPVVSMTIQEANQEAEATTSTPGNANDDSDSNFDGEESTNAPKPTGEYEGEQGVPVQPANETVYQHENNNNNNSSPPRTSPSVNNSTVAKDTGSNSAVPSSILILGFCMLRSILY